MIPGQYHCLSDGSPAVDARQAAGELLNSLMKWVEQATAPGTFSFPLAQPTAKLSAITVRPLSPLSPPPRGARGLNTRYRWIGQFRLGDKLWCATHGMDLACSRHQPPITYTADVNTKADPAPAGGAGQPRVAPVLRVTRHEHAASLTVSMAGTVILWLPATTS
jgi:hypothetical protein